MRLSHKRLQLGHGRPAVVRYGTVAYAVKESLDVTVFLGLGPLVSENKSTNSLHDVFVGVPGKTQQVDGAAAAAKPRRSIGSRPPANPSNSEEHALVGSPRGPRRRYGDAAALRTRELLRPNSVEIAASDHRSSGRTSF